MEEETIKKITERFLTWPLPEDFSPDAGISFNPVFNENTDHPMRHKPTGTNLLNYTQAKQMVLHILGQP